MVVIKSCDVRNLLNDAKPPSYLSKTADSRVESNSGVRFPPAENVHERSRTVDVGQVDQRAEIDHFLDLKKVHKLFRMIMEGKQS